MHMLMYRCALAAVAEVHACVCRCARAVSVVRVVCVRARAIAGAAERVAHLRAQLHGYSTGTDPHAIRNLPGTSTVQL